MLPNFFWCPADPKLPWASALSQCKELRFPPDFKFGTATGAYQVEGAWNIDNKSLSYWDQIIHDNPSIILDSSNGDIACDSYHKWKEDVEMLKYIGFHYYRFSIAWSRILIDGYPTLVNPAGIKYYKNLIKSLKRNGIEPVVTMYHFDPPAKFNGFGGINNEGIVNLFVSYADILFKNFGDDVKIWLTINQPDAQCYLFNKDFSSYQPPNYPDGIVEYFCAKTILKIHAEVYKLYQEKYKSTQNGKIGIALHLGWSEPTSDNPEDVEAAERKRQFDFGLYAHPLIFSDYPDVVIKRLERRSELQNFVKSRLPALSDAEKQLISKSVDFIGLNHYVTSLVSNIEEPPITHHGYNSDTKTNSSYDPSWESTGMSVNKVVPWGLRKALKWVKETYNNTEILITELGYSDTTGTLEDYKRINYFEKYFESALQAIEEDKVNLKGIIVWCLMDNFEWFFGYTVKFGIHYVNFTDPNRTRTMKKSAYYLKELIAKHIT